MQIVSLPRRAGHTTKAIKWVKKKPYRYLVVLNRDQQEFIRRRFDIPGEQVITISDLRKGGVFLGRPHEPEVLLDNIEMVLPALLPVPVRIEGFTSEPATDDFFDRQFRGNPSVWKAVHRVQ